MELWNILKGVYSSFLQYLQLNYEKSKKIFIPFLKHHLHLHCCKNYNYTIVTVAVVEQSVKSFGSFTFAASHLERKVWGGWRGLFPYLTLTLGTPFGLLAAAFVMPAWVSDLRVGPLKGECRKIFHHLNLCYVVIPYGHLGI